MSIDRVQYQCDECEEIVAASIGQTIINSQLKWYLSYECQECNSTIELDDIGFPPNEIRQIILAEEGEWKLTANRTEIKNKAKLLKIIRQALNLSLQEVSKLFKNFPVLTSGTKTEMQWLQQILSQESINSSVEKKIPVSEK